MSDHVRMAIEIAGGEFSDEAHCWLQTGMTRFLTIGGKLEQALEITGTHRRIYRDRALKRAAAELKGERKISTLDLAGELAQLLKRYEPSHGSRARDSLPPLQQALFDAYSSGCELIGSQRKLYDFLK